MIKNIRKIIAYYISIFLMVVSFGLIKVNFSGEPTVSTPTFKNKSEISREVDENIENKNT